MSVGLEIFLFVAHIWDNHLVPDMTVKHGLFISELLAASAHLLKLIGEAGSINIINYHYISFVVTFFRNLNIPKILYSFQAWIIKKYVRHPPNDVSFEFVLFLVFFKFYYTINIRLNCKI